ncbi:hypothetical protein RND81_06G074000 [Saponaria officinalis]|uniref:Secreted peptide n=1 Tax=Saponaria officinalis TaxID=3572 RepID=A0AAW1K4L6_SAPOF
MCGFALCCWMITFLLPFVGHFCLMAGITWLIRHCFITCFVTLSIALVSKTPLALFLLDRTAGINVVNRNTHILPSNRHVPSSAHLGLATAAMDIILVMNHLLLHVLCGLSLSGNRCNIFGLF